MATTTTSKTGNGPSVATYTTSCPDAVQIIKLINHEADQVKSALRTLIQAAKAMPEHSYTPAQMALDDAIEAAEEVMKEVE